jgi:cytochrome c-type biogenesis protein CcmH
MLQRGERRAALDAWVALIADTPADAAWLPDLRSQAAALAEDLGLDPEQVLPAAPAVTGVTPAPDAPGPTAEDMRAARDLSAEDRETMIRGMVEGLAARVEAQPDDLEGWRRLARSWGVLGEPEKSADAYAQVARLAPEDVGAQVDYAGALLALGSPERPPSPEVVAQLQKVLTLDQDNPEALFHLGRAAAAQGDASGAAQHWQRLLAQLPASSPERAALQRLLQSLESGG